MLRRPLDDPFDDDATGVMGPEGGGGGGGGGGVDGAPWQAVVPESVNVRPGSATNRQS